MTDNDRWKNICLIEVRQCLQAQLRKRDIIASFLVVRVLLSFPQIPAKKSRLHSSLMTLKGEYLNKNSVISIFLSPNQH